MKEPTWFQRLLEWATLRINYWRMGCWRNNHDFEKVSDDMYYCWYCGMEVTK